MDHAGDMLWYIHHALRQTWDYPGILAWGDIDAYKATPPKDPDWEISDRDHSRAIMWAKDGAFEVSIRHLNDDELHGLPTAD